MEKYLYGAAVQGIQQFIYKTNELKDIVGASELVEQICSDLFQDLLYGEDPDKKLSDDENAIVHAAGNIKYIFSADNLDNCRKIVREFPKTVVEFAPTVTVSQAVVRFDNENEGFSKAVMTRAATDCTARWPRRRYHASCKRRSPCLTHRRPTHLPIP